MNILITSAGQRVSLVKAFRDELRQRFSSGRVFTTDLSPALSAACNISDGYFRVRRVTEPGYMDDLLQICLANDIAMVVPTIDTELPVLAAHRERFRREGIHIVVSTPTFVEQCRDKRKTNKFFQGKGLDIPAAVDKDNPEFPLFIKPHDGSLSADICVVHEEGGLSEEHLAKDRFMFMEYLDGECHDEYSVDMYYDQHGHAKCIVPRKRISVRAGEISKGVTIKNGLLECLKRALPYIEGAAGVLTAQFFLDRSSGRIIGIEINARFGGGFPLSYQAGANYPGWLIDEYLGHQEIPYREDWEAGLLMLRYDDEVLVHGYAS